MSVLHSPVCRWHSLILRLSEQRAVDRLFSLGHAHRLLNRCWVAIYALGVAPNYLVTLEVSGRRSGRIIGLPLVMVVVEGERYLVSMLGADINWVHNVQAAGGNVTLVHGRREEVHLDELAAESRARVLQAYVQRAPGARVHLPIQSDAPLAAFEQVAPQFHVFRVVARNTACVGCWGARWNRPATPSIGRTVATKRPAY